MARASVVLLGILAAGATLLVPVHHDAPAAPAEGPEAPAPAPGREQPRAQVPAEPTPPVPEPNRASSPLGGAALRDELRRALGERQSLDAERQALAAERAALEARAAEIARAREELRAETAKLEALLARRADGSEGAGPSATDGSGAPDTTPAGLLALAKAAKGMKPAEMAAVLQHLAPATAADVLLRMRPADSGAVLASLPPEKAAVLAAEMTRRPAPRGTP